MSNKLGMPEQCEQTGKAFTDAYGYNRAMDVIERKITTLRKAHALIDVRNNTQLKIDLACDVDFWSQTMQALTINN